MILSWSHDLKFIHLTFNDLTLIYYIFKSLVPFHNFIVILMNSYIQIYVYHEYTKVEEYAMIN